MKLKEFNAQELYVNGLRFFTRHEPYRRLLIDDFLLLRIESFLDAIADGDRDEEPPVLITLNELEYSRANGRPVDWGNLARKLFMETNERIKSFEFNNRDSEAA